MNINKMLAKVFGSANEREVKRLRPLVEQINALEPDVKKLTDDELRLIISKAQALLRASVGKDNALGLTRRPTMYAYMRGGQPCRRCHTTLRSAPQGVDIRHTAWCPKCQPVVEGQLQPPASRTRRPLVVDPRRQGDGASSRR